MKKLISILSLFLVANTVGFAQTITDTLKPQEVQKSTFTCPHHKDVVSDTPGKCSKCGMELVEKTTLKQDPLIKGSQMKASKEKVYECSMCKITSKKPSKCPKCGKEMVEKDHKM